MTEDAVVREVRAAREAFAASHRYDIAAMVASLREVAAASGREVVRFAPRPVVLARPHPAPQPTGGARGLPELPSPPSPAGD